MTRQKYDTKESLNRILRLFQGRAIPTDIPNGVTGEVLSIDEALSDLAELFAGSLPNATAVLPASFNITGAYFSPAVGLFAASPSDLFAGVVTSKAVVASSLNYISQVCAEIWTYTGTTTLTGLTADTFFKITGSFHQNQQSRVYQYSRADAANDQIVISGSSGGLYQIEFQCTFIGSPDITYALQPFYANTGIPQVTGGAKPYASGSAVSVSGCGFAYISGTPAALDLRVACGQTGWFRMISGQLMSRRLGTG